jgi:hypothetical protein
MKEMRWMGGGGVYRVSDRRENAYRFMVSEPEGRGLLSNPRCGWEDNIKMDLKKRLEGVTE